LYQVLDVPFFRVWGAIYSVFTVLMWIIIFYRTVALVPNGRIFEAPSLEVKMWENKSPLDTPGRECGVDA
jgi:tellurite resistance protein TehA-like permease